MNFRFAALFIFVFAFSFAKAYPVELTEDDRYFYTKKAWNEIADDYQRALIHFFNNRLYEGLNHLDIPTSWTEAAQEILMGSQEQFNAIIEETRARANSYASAKNLENQDFFPVGFMVGIGVNGSGSFAVGIGGSALLTLVVVPFEVVRVDKATQESDQYFELSWAVGGMGQGGIGAGAGGGMVVHVAMGLIWGPLPEASELQGPAAGITGSIGYLQGLGFKVAKVFNSATKMHNLVALATVDIGAAVHAEVQGALFYFMSPDEIISFIGGSSIGQVKGAETVFLSDLYSHPVYAFTR